MFIVALEGIDKSGKESQARMLAEHIRAQRHSVIEEAFPRYNTDAGRRIKEMLHTVGAVDPVKLAKLFELDRYNFFESLTEEPNVLILDRYIMSNTFALSKGMDEVELMWLQHGLPPANLHIVVDIPVEVSLERAQAYAVLDEHEKDIALLTETRNRYLAYAEVGSYYDKGSVVRINGNQSREDVHADILNAVYEVYPVIFSKKYSGIRS